MRNSTIFTLVSGVLLANSPAALTLLPDPASSSASSFHSAPYASDNLYDANPTLGDVGTDFSAGASNQYAGLGGGPHVIIYDFGLSVAFNGIAYSQRLGGDPILDKVQNIEVWATDSDPGPATLALPGTLGAAMGNTGQLDTTAGATTFNNYPVGDLSGRYVIFRFNDAGGNVGNPGGSELQLTHDPIPEPSTGLLGLFGMCMLLRRRRWNSRTL